MCTLQVPQRPSVFPSDLYKWPHFSVIALFFHCGMCIRNRNISSLSTSSVQFMQEEHIACLCIVLALLLCLHTTGTYRRLWGFLRPRSAQERPTRAFHGPFFLYRLRSVLFTHEAHLVCFCIALALLLGVYTTGTYRRLWRFLRPRGFRGPRGVSTVVAGPNDSVLIPSCTQCLDRTCAFTYAAFG